MTKRVFIDGAEFELVPTEWTGDDKEGTYLLKPITKQEKRYGTWVVNSPDDYAVVAQYTHKDGEWEVPSDNQRLAIRDFIQAGLEYIQTPYARNDWDKAEKVIEEKLNPIEELANEARKLMNETKPLKEDIK